MRLRTPEVVEFELSLFFVAQALCLPGRNSSRPSSGITASAGNAEMNLGAADTSVRATSGVAAQIWLISVSRPPKFAGTTSGVRRLLSALPALAVMPEEGRDESRPGSLR